VSDQNRSGGSGGRGGQGVDAGRGGNDGTGGKDGPGGKPGRGGEGGGSGKSGGGKASGNAGGKASGNAGGKASGNAGGKASGNASGKASGKGGGKGGSKRAARERLHEQRAQQQRSDRRRRTTNIIIFVVVAIVAIGIIWFAASRSSDEGPSDAAQPALVQEPGGGVVLGDGPVDVTLWEDFQCPSCKAFEATNGEALRERVDAGDITLTIHPVSFLDRNLGNTSSSLAANAFGCVVDTGEQQALDYHLTLYANQPEENPGTEAWSSEDLIGWANDVGASGAEVEDCINSMTYEDWVQQVQASMSDEGVTATPTVFVDGEPFDVAAGDLEATIDDALKGNQ
jgi:protein-disulfide isomerase